MTTPQNEPLRLTDAVHSALANAPWISAADTGAVAWCLYLADKIQGDDEALQRFGKLFESSLNMLGLSISGRSAKPDVVKEKVNPLAEIRQNSISRKSAAQVADTASPRGESGRGRGGNGQRRGNSSTTVAGNGGVGNRKNKS